MPLTPGSGGRAFLSAAEEDDRDTLIIDEVREGDASVAIYVVTHTGQVRFGPPRFDADAAEAIGMELIAIAEALRQG